MTPYTINNRTLQALYPLDQELHFESEASYLFELSDLGMLDVKGDAANTFLQGQLTCDVNLITSEHMCPGALCNLQGRIMALMDVVLWQGFHLIMPIDMLDATQASMAKAALFSRVTLEKNTTYCALGFYIQDRDTADKLQDILPQRPWQTRQTDQHYVYALSEHLFVLLVKQENKDKLIATLPPMQRRGSLAWHYLQLQLPRISLYPNTRGLFLPHRLHLQHTPYLSFNKGCYKGQEIIARTHYRAKPKHALKQYEFQSIEPIFAGQKIFNPVDQQEIGELIDYCPIGEHHYIMLASMTFEHPNQVLLDQHQDATLLQVVLS